MCRAMVIYLLIGAFALGVLPTPVVAQQWAPTDHEPGAVALLLILNCPVTAIRTTGSQEISESYLIGQAIDNLLRFSILESKEPESFFQDYSSMFQVLSASADGRIVVVLHVSQRKDGPRKAAEAVGLVQKRLQAAFDEISEANAAEFLERLNLAGSQLDRARARVMDSRNEVETYRSALIRAGGFYGGIDEQLNRLKETRLNLRVENAGLQARHESILEHIEESAEKLKRAETEEELLPELEKIVKLREGQLARVRELISKGVESTATSHEVSVQLATARADVAKRRAEIAHKSGSQQLHQLNQQLVDVQTEIAAAEAQLQSIDELLKPLESGEVRKLVGDLEQATREWDNAVAQERLAVEEYSAAKRALHAVPRPRVVRIGSRSD